MSSVISRKKTDEEPRPVTIRPEYSRYQNVFSPRDTLENQKSYVNRMNHCGYIFERKMTETERTLIEAARHDGFFWRGEPIEHFRIFYDRFMDEKSMKEEQKRAERKKVMRFAGVNRSMPYHEMVNGIINE